MGFEDRIISKVDRERSIGEHPMIMKMHEKAEKILADDAIDPHDFIDLYGEENVARDLETVAKLKAKFEVDDTKHAAEVLEALIYEQAELSDWLGPNAETIRPSEYDDLINGTDLIVQFSSNNSTNHLALGIDITFGSQTMRKKFDRIKNEIDDDELAKIKYFESHGFKGSLKQLPRIVIGVEKDTVISLAGLWLREQKADIGKHFAREIILSEIEKQLVAFLYYAERSKKENAVKSYTVALATVKNIQRESKFISRSASENESVRNDRVYQEIQKQLEIFRTPSR